MKYTDKQLQDHEFNYWINSHKQQFLHKNFYKQFYDFNQLANKKVVEIGCGGAPISEYCDCKDLNLTIVDPLIEKLIQHNKYAHLKKYNYFSGSLFDFNGTNYDCLVCLNVIDHFNDPEYKCIEKFYDILSNNSELWLYYDLRSKNSDNHLAINEEEIIKEIKNKFKIIKISDSINPNHIRWSSVYKSIRMICKKQ